MKKTVILILSLCILTLSLSSCLTPRVTYEPANGTEGIASVKIYYVGRYDGFYERKDESELEELAVASEEISSDCYGELFSDLEKLKFENFIPLLPIPFDPNFYICGYILVISYEDGGYEYITPDSIQIWGENTEDSHCAHLTCEDEEWEDFISKYAPDLYQNTKYAPDPKPSVPTEESFATTDP